MTLGNAWYLLILVPVAGAAAAMVLTRRWRARLEPASRFPSASMADGIPATLRARASSWLWVPGIAALALMAVALARPRRGIETVLDTTKGVDIALCIDVSGSMRETDLSRGETRLDVAKEAAGEFVSRRPHDRIALVPFAKHAYRLAPLTLHHEWVKAQLARLRIRDSERAASRARAGAPPREEPGLIDESRTAIGTALSTAVNALRPSTAKAKVVVLLTDGRSNFGKLSPLEGAEIAREMGVRVYTIGAGRAEERAAFGFRLGTYEPVDEETLREVASKTGGKYFRARDRASLERIYQEIDALEKTEASSMRYTRYVEHFGALAAPAAILVALRLALSMTLLRRSP